MVVEQQHKRKEEASWSIVVVVVVAVVDVLCLSDTRYISLFVSVPHSLVVRWVFDMACVDSHPGKDTSLSELSTTFSITRTTTRGCVVSRTERERYDLANRGNEWRALRESTSLNHDPTDVVNICICAIHIIHLTTSDNTSG